MSVLRNPDLEMLRRQTQSSRYSFKNIFIHFFSRSPRPTLRPTQPTLQWVPLFFPGGKAAGACRG
jgi:hypothetical protein